MTELRELSRGHWYYSVKDFVYDEAYWNKYVKYSKTETGAHLLEYRLRLIHEFFPGKPICDVGIGSGDIVKAHPRCYGYDVNPVAVKWLQSIGKFHDIYAMVPPVMTFFDSLEHIDDPSCLLEETTAVIVSMPIYKDIDDLLISKHYRPDEHCHYFTEEGFIDFMTDFGFAFYYIGDGEQHCGREAIMTYVCVKQ